MLFETEDEIRDFATVYRKEYKRKRIRKSFKAKLFAPNDDPNPIAGAYENHLNTQKQNEQLRHARRTETLQDYLNKVRSQHPHLKIFLRRDPPDETIVEREQKKLLRSVYQLEIAKNLDCLSEDKNYRTVTIPEDSLIPETMHKKLFRDPRYFKNNNLLKVEKPKKTPDNLGVNEKEREILRVRTGNTQYQEVIGKVGQRIIKEQMFGPPIPIESPKRQVKDPDSARSDCSQILMNISKKNILSQVF